MAKMAVQTCPKLSVEFLLAYKPVGLHHYIAKDGTADITWVEKKAVRCE